MSRSPSDFIISSFSKSSLEYLQKAFTTQSEQINVVVSDRNWLERENNIKSATLIRLNETNIEYQRYLHQREAAMAIELGKQQQIQKEQN